MVENTYPTRLMFIFALHVYFGHQISAFPESISLKIKAKTQKNYVTTRILNSVKPWYNMFCIHDLKDSLQIGLLEENYKSVHFMLI